MNKKKNTTMNRVFTVILTTAIIFTGIFTGSYNYTMASGNKTSGNKTSSNKTSNDKSDVITKKQADKMALELTNKIWVWDWIKFFVPYMSEKGVKKLIPASRNSEWAGFIDMTTGKKMKFTKKQVNTARKKKPSKSLTCGDIDAHALMIMQSNGDWDCISFMLPYMSHKGIRAVVRCYNSKHNGKGKKAKDYY